MEFLKNCFLFVLIIPKGWLKNDGVKKSFCIFSEICQFCSVPHIDPNKVLKVFGSMSNRRIFYTLNAFRRR